MSDKEEILRRLDDNYCERREALSAENIDQVKELYEEESRLLDELHKIIWGDVDLAVDRPRGGPRKAP